MLTLYTKERLSRPELSIVTEGQPVVKSSSTIDKLLALDPQNFDISDDEDDNYSGSDISDPFTDMKQTDTIEKDFEKAKKRLSRLEQSMQLMALFTDDFQKAMDEAKEELQTEAKRTYNNMDELRNTRRKANKIEELSKTFEEKMNKIFRDKEYLSCDRDLDIPEPEPAEADKDFDIMSGMWKMLKTSETLIASPPNYNTFNQQSPHWLDRNGVSLQTMDNATCKCNNWLEIQENIVSLSKITKLENKNLKE